MFEIYNVNTGKAVKEKKFKYEDAAQERIQYIEFVQKLNGIYQKDELAVREVKDE